MQSLLFSFQGRINRAKFWLIHVVMWIILAIVFSAVFGAAAVSSDPEAALNSVGPIGAIVFLVAYVLSIWIGLAVAAKRWHDRDKTAWWILIAFVPVIGGLWFLIECGFLRGTVGPNKFGPDPLGV